MIRAAENLRFINHFVPRILLVFLNRCTGLFLAKNLTKFLAINIYIFFFNETKSGHPNKHLFHWHFENLMVSFFLLQSSFFGKIRPLASLKQRPTCDQCLVEQTAYRTEIKRPRDNGYKSIFTNPWLLCRKNRSSIKGLGKNQQKEWTRSLFAVPFVRGHPTVTPWTPRNDCVYTRQPQLWHATSGVLTSLPTKLAKIGMRVKTLSARRHKQKEGV